MKINYSTYPALELLERKKQIDFTIDDIGDFPALPEFFSSRIETFFNFFDKNNIIKPSDAFWDAARLAMQNKMTDLVDELINEFKGQSGIVLTHTTTLFFKFPAQYVDFEYIIFRNHGNLITPLQFLFQVTDDKQFNWNSSCVLDNAANTASRMFGNTLILLAFKKYANVEMKFLPAGQKVKEIDCKYINDTKFNITYLDSKWFTTLVKSDAFKVRGHFRLQPKKINGQWTKELIWINDFMKTGYTAPARKLKED